MDRNRLRKRRLSSGWYPDNSSEIREFIKNVISESSEKDRNKKAVIVPHAGWFFSGSLAVRAIKTLTENPSIVVVVGGHLPPGSRLHYSPEDLFETPLGDLSAEKEFIKRLGSELNIKEDISSDNTVEVQMTIIKYFYPNSKVVWLRIGSGKESIELGSLIYKIVSDLQQETIVIGSTDLTHYGSNFMFSPMGSGPDAVTWVKDINDRDIIDKMVALDCTGVIKSATSNYSACSAGAAAAAMQFAKLSGISSGKLIDYFNSYDISESESFVGYTGISF